ncbi:MAG: hypothetical protein HOV66_27925 [Streptomycetaceae bacterium]|nr:hypothetical protein [Streptomycetaceae bacterium]
MSVSPQMLLAVTRVIAKGQYRNHAPGEIAQTLANLGFLRDEPAPAEQPVVPLARCAVCGKPHRNSKGFREGVGWHAWVSPRRVAQRGGAS